MKSITATLLAVLAISAVPLEAQAGQAACDKYNGKAYILCSEGGPERMPEGYPPGKPHPGPSSASGPCGFISATRRQYGGDGMEACERYMRDRYGSWAAAERKHRRSNFW